MRLACDLPLLVKLPADLPDPGDAARGGAGGAVAATLAGGLPALGGVAHGAGPSRLAGVARRGGRLTAVLAGGAWSGPATFPVVLALVARLAAGPRCP